MAYYYGPNQWNTLLINANSGFKEHQDIDFERGARYIIRYKYGFPYFIGEFHAYNSINNRKIPTFKILHKSKDDILRVGKFDRIWVHAPKYVYKKASDFPRLDYLSLISESGKLARANEEDRLEIYQPKRSRNLRHSKGGKRYCKSRKQTKVKRRTGKRQRTKKCKRNK